MKTAGCLAIVFILLLAISFGGLFLLDRIQPEDLRIDRLEEEEEKFQGSALREFKRTDNHDEYVLNYGFIDYRRQVHRVSCGIKRSDHEQQMKRLGYNYDRIKREADTEVQKIFDAEIKRLGFAPYLTLRIENGGGYRWKYQIPGSNPEWQKNMEDQIKQYVAGFRSSVDTRHDAVKNRLLQEGGFKIVNQTITPDYTAMADWGVDPLRHCFQQLFESARNYSERDLIGMYLAFFQEIKYEVPPDKIEDRSVQGIYAPTEVVANNHGDCDSKSVAFSSMLKTLGLRSIIIVIDDPSHALVGVEGKPGPDDRFVRAGNRYYVLCEVAGPGKYPPGRAGFEVKGAFEYQIVEP